MWLRDFFFFLISVSLQSKITLSEENSALRRHFRPKCTRGLWLWNWWSLMSLLKTSGPTLPLVTPLETHSLLPVLGDTGYSANQYFPAQLQQMRLSVWMLVKWAILRGRPPPTQASLQDVSRNTEVSVSNDIFKASLWWKALVDSVLCSAAETARSKLLQNTAWHEIWIDLVSKRVS